MDEEDDDEEDDFVVGFVFLLCRFFDFEHLHAFVIRVLEPSVLRRFHPLFTLPVPLHEHVLGSDCFGCFVVNGHLQCLVFRVLEPSFFVGFHPSFTLPVPLHGHVIGFDWSKASRQI